MHIKGQQQGLTWELNTGSENEKPEAEARKKQSSRRKAWEWANLEVSGGCTAWPRSPTKAGAKSPAGMAVPRRWLCFAASSPRQCALCLQQPLESVVLFAQPLGRPPRGGGGCHPPPGLLKIDGPSLLHPLTHLTPPQAWLSDHVWTPLLSAGLHQKH